MILDGPLERKGKNQKKKKKAIKDVLRGHWRNRSMKYTLYNIIITFNVLDVSIVVMQEDRR